MIIFLKGNFFYILLFSLNLTALAVTFSKNMIYSLISLISTFVISSFLLILIECEFLAFIFIIIYVGAITVLLLFAIMMLDYKFVNRNKNYNNLYFVSLFCVLFFLYPFLSIVLKYNLSDLTLDLATESKISQSQLMINWFDLIDAKNDIEIYGQLLYTDYVIQFLLIGLILLVVLIGVVYLTKSPKNLSFSQVSFKQLSRRAKIY